MIKIPLLVSIITYILVILLFNVLGEKHKVYKTRLKDIKNVNKPTLPNNDIMELSFEERFIKPLVDKMIQSAANLFPIKKKSQIKLGQKLSKAGINMSPKDYRAMNLIIIIGFGVVSGYIGSRTGANIIQLFLYLIIGIFFGYVYRRYSLETKISNRKKEIKSQLPQVIDILSVSIVAGLSFDQALEYVIERTKGPLIDEFHIVKREINLGKKRKDALKALGERCEIDEVKSFTSSVIQADELGTSMQNVLNSQSKMLRISHKQEVEEAAAKIPVKILIPMVVFIFPVIFIVLLGPAVPQIIEALGN
ncbi:type II secretion system F family protein [Proteinivorax tanatarense]|uniref:Type II secretion system F family protein n=1 Tax=Proteinivorax tanatarense TaxID=1260629 RepID=A0AAU7VKI6_9FIRM